MAGVLLLLAGLAFLVGCQGASTADSSGTLGSSPTSLNFGNVEVGNKQTLSETLTNTSSSSISISQVSLSGPAFKLSGATAPLTLNAGQSVTVSVTFAPTAAGNASGTITVGSNASNSTVTITLSGTGTTTAPTYSVNLSWNASTSPNISGYNIYRATYVSSCGSFSKINSLLNTGTLYTDSTVTDGTSYCYATTAVNSSGEESGYSNIVSNVQIPAP